MSKLAISFAIKLCIRIEVPSGITAHFVLSAATSAALNNNASMEEVCKAATWSSISMFVRHYKLDVYSSLDASFGQRVLQHVLPDEDDVPP